MKDTTKWILAAIAVILIIAVGAYAFSNGNGSPTATPTATPEATATPTPAPAVSATAGPTVTPAPTTTPSATPAPTAAPTQSAGSGVKQTEFGYYITYPPFSYSDVHEGPHYAAPSPSPSPSVSPSPSPSPTPEGTVTFAYGYGSINWDYGEPWSSSTVEFGDPVNGYLPIYFLLHRTGDTSNAYWTDIEVSASISEWGYHSANPGFNAGSADMIYELDLPVSYLTDNVYTEATLTLDDPDPYTATPNQVFWLYINGEAT